MRQVFVYITRTQRALYLRTACSMHYIPGTHSIGGEVEGSRSNKKERSWLVCQT